MKITSRPPQQPIAPKPPVEHHHEHHHEGWLHNSLDAVHVGLELVHHAPEGRLHDAGAAVAGIATVGALVDGFQRLKSANCNFDRLHATASLALAGEMGLMAAGHLSGHEETLEKIGMPFGLLHHGIEIYTGACEALHAYHDGNQQHLVGGLCRVGMEAGLAAAHFFPGAALGIRLGAAACLVTSEYLLRSSR